MQYKFLASHRDWLPVEPAPVDMESGMYFNHIIVPKFVAVGGIQEFAKYLLRKNLIQHVTYSSDTEKAMSIQLQNQLTADGYPPNVIEMFSIFQNDSINGMLEQFARQDDDIRQRSDNNWLPMSDSYQVKLKQSVKIADLQRFGYDGSTACNPRDSRKVKSTGYIRWLHNLPIDSTNGSLDIGTFIYLTYYYQCFTYILFTIMSYIQME